jgi:nitrate reductase gamma subunit
MVNSYADLANKILEIVKNLTALGAALALFFFLLGIVRYLTHSDNASKRTESVQTITYGLVALFVLITVWGLVVLIQQSIFGSSSLVIPQF